MVSILIMNGPNLNLLGTRQPEVYGPTTLKEIEDICSQQASSVGADLTFFQSNHEGDLIDQIHAARGRFDGIILNAGALSHTSIAIMDALLGVEIPTIDLHLSNIHRREEFRSASYVAKAAVGTISGFGPGGYLLAIDAMMMHLSSPPDADAEADPTPEDDDAEVEETSPPLTTTKEQMVESEAPAHSEESSDLTTLSQSLKSKTESSLASEIAAAAASAIAAQRRELEQAAKSAEPAEEAPANEKPEKDAKPKGTFNEMFDTPSKEVLDSLGIIAPELDPPAKKEEAPKEGKSRLRGFRKFS